MNLQIGSTLEIEIQLTGYSANWGRGNCRGGVSTSISNAARKISDSGTGSVNQGKNSFIKSE